MSIGAQTALLAAAVLAACLAWLRWPNNPFRHSSESPLASLKTVVEIAAILLAGFWAYTRFVRVDQPSLATNLKFSVELLRDSSATGPHCVMLARTGVENMARSIVKITGVTQSVWLVPDSVLWRGDPTTYVDLEQFTKDEGGAPSGLKSFVEDGPLAYAYAPGAAASYDIPWLVPLMDSTTTLLTRLDFTIAGSPHGDFYYTWGKPCLQPPPAALPADSAAARAVADSTAQAAAPPAG